MQMQRILYPASNSYSFASSSFATYQLQLNSCLPCWMYQAYHIQTYAKTKTHFLSRHVFPYLYSTIQVYHGLSTTLFLSLFFLSTDIGLTVGTPKTYAQRCWPSQLPPADHLRGFDGPETRKTWKSDKEQYSQTVLEETLHPEPKKETLQ